MKEFEDIQERLESAIVRCAQLLNKHGSTPCTTSDIANTVLAKEINYLTLAINRQAVAMDDIAGQALVIGKALEALLEQIVTRQENMH